MRLLRQTFLWTALVVVTASIAFAMPHEGHGSNQTRDNILSHNRVMEAMSMDASHTDHSPIGSHADESDCLDEHCPACLTAGNAISSSCALCFIMPDSAPWSPESNRIGIEYCPVRALNSTTEMEELSGPERREYASSFDLGDSLRSRSRILRL